MRPIYELCTQDPARIREELSTLSPQVLLEELDDTIQFDILKLGCDEWEQSPGKKLYHAILKEIYRRLSIEQGE